MIHAILDLKGSRGMTASEYQGHMRAMTDRLSEDEAVRMESPPGWARGDQIHLQPLDEASLHALARIAVGSGDWYLAVGIGSLQRWGPEGNGVRGQAFRRADRAMPRTKDRETFLAVEPQSDFGVGLERSLDGHVTA